MTVSLPFFAASMECGCSGIAGSYFRHDHFCAAVQKLLPTMTPLSDDTAKNESDVFVRGRRLARKHLYCGDVILAHSELEGRFCWC